MIKDKQNSKSYEQVLNNSVGYFNHDNYIRLVSITFEIYDDNFEFFDFSID